MISYPTKSWIAVLSFQLLVTAVTAQIWTGNVNSNWNNPANWSGNVIPEDGTDIVIDPINYTGAAANPVLTGSAVFSPSLMTVLGGAHLTIQGSLSTSDRLIIEGEGTVVNMNSGVLNIAIEAARKMVISDDAAFNFTGGTITVGRDLSIGLGGRFNMSSPAVLNINLGLLVGDNSSTGISKFMMTGGTVTILQDLEFDALDAGDTPTVEIEGGTMTVFGAAVWQGGPSDAPHLVMTGGTTTIIGDAVSGGAKVDIDISGNAILSFHANLWMLGVYDRFDQSGNSSVTFEEQGMWHNNGRFTATSGSLIVEGSRILSGSSENFHFHHVIIKPGSVLEHLAPAVIEIGGNWMNDGVFLPKNNAILFSGNEDQVIGGDSTSHFYGITMNKPDNDLILEQHISLGGTLNLIKGRIFSTPFSSISLLDNAQASSGNHESYVDGPLRKIGDEPFAFPVGSQGEIRHIAISAPGGQSSEYTAEFVAATPPDQSCLDFPLTGISGNGYWNLQQTNGDIAPVYVTLFWSNAAESGITDCASLAIGSHSGTCWSELQAGAGGNCSGSGSGYLQSNDPVVPNGALTFSIDGSGTCTTPENVSIIHQAPNKIVMNWAPEPGAAAYHIRYRLLGSSLWKSVIVGVPYRVLSNLSSGSTYFFELRTLCPLGWTATTTGTFTTYHGTEPCSTPSPALAIPIGPTIEQLFWEVMPLAESYMVRYRPIGILTWNASTTFSPGKQLTGLIPDQEYEYQLRVRCGGSWTPYSFSGYFTTMPPGFVIGNTPENDPEAFADWSLAVAPNPANKSLKVTWQGEQPSEITIKSLVDGRPVLQVAQFDEMHEINISRLEPGAYVLEAKTSNFLIRQIKFIKCNSD
ncbi:MAG: T9SS type A sorting domain-containing protein [Saprospiraceae bacterium]|nr:T9SS type A sorting domain-containing protein [Saprospiraceae bacterium]